MALLKLSNLLKTTQTILIVAGLCAQLSYGAGEDPAPPLQEDHCTKWLSQLSSNPFNPANFKQQRGQKQFNQPNALRHLKKLEEYLGRSPIPDITCDIEFLVLRDQLTDCLLKPFYIAWGIQVEHAGKITGIKLHFSPGLEKIINKQWFKKLLDKIYSQSLFFRNLDNVFDQESTSTRSDDCVESTIEVDPFFEPLGLLLSNLYDPNLPKTKDTVKAIRDELEKRYDYFSYIEPLERVLPIIGRIVSSDRSPDRNKWILCLIELNSIIHYDIDYKYGLYDKYESGRLGKDLIGFRKSIPWTDMAVLGSAWHHAMYGLETVNKATRELMRKPVSPSYNLIFFRAVTSGDFGCLVPLMDSRTQQLFLEQNLIRQVFAQATDDLMAEFRILEDDLKKLKTMEHNHPSSKESPNKNKYTNMGLFKNWAFNFKGLEMMKSHMGAVKRSCKGSSLHPQYRLFMLYHLFMDGELSKYFVETLKGSDQAWQELFEAFKGLRNPIMHGTQNEGLEKFEQRLNTGFPQAQFDQLITAYCDVFDLIPSRDYLVLMRQSTWTNMKEHGGNLLPTPNAEQKKKLVALKSQLESLVTFITTVTVEDPTTALKEQFNAEMKTFKEQECLQKKKYRDQFPKNLLEKESHEWYDTLQKISGVMDKEMKARWKKLETISAEYRYLKEKQGLTGSLGTLHWTLSKIKDVHLDPKIEDFYLILLRESANHVLDLLPSHIISRANKGEIRDRDAERTFIRECSFLCTSLRALITHFGNRTAHLHGLTEASIFEIYYESKRERLPLQAAEALKRIDGITQNLRPQASSQS